MRVVFDGQVFSGHRAGGVSRYLANLLAGLDREPGVTARALAPLYRTLYLDDIPRRLVWGMKAPTEAIADRFSDRALRQLSGPIGVLLRPDIVHESYFTAKPLITAGRRRVATMYDMIHERYGLDAATTRNKRATIDRCDHVICISHQTRNDLLEIFGFPPERASVVHLGYQNAGGNSPPLGAEFFDAPFFLFVGSRSHYKNFALFVRAFSGSLRLVKDFRVVCFGGGAFSADELALIHDLNLTDRILQTAGPDSKLASLYQTAVALVYPSLYEGFGLPPLEAMSASCPVLCSSTSSIPEVVGDAGLFFDPREIDSLRVAMEFIADDADLRRDLVTRGHIRRKLFTWQRCVSETLNIYRGLS